MAERAATKSRKGGITAAGSSWIPEDKRLSKVFSKTEICVTYVPSRQTRAALAADAIQAALEKASTENRVATAIRNGMGAREASTRLACSNWDLGALSAGMAPRPPRENPAGVRRDGSGTELRVDKLFPNIEVCAIHFPMTCRLASAAGERGAAAREMGAGPQPKRESGARGNFSI